MVNLFIYFWYKLDPNSLKTIKDIQKEKLNKIKQEREQNEKVDDGIENNDDYSKVDNSNKEQIDEEDDDKGGDEENENEENKGKFQSDLKYDAKDKFNKNEFENDKEGDKTKFGK